MRLITFMISFSRCLLWRYIQTHLTVASRQRPVLKKKIFKQKSFLDWRIKKVWYSLIYELFIECLMEQRKIFFLVLAVTIFNRCFKSKPYLLISFEWSILSFFLSSLSIDALKPRDSIDSIMSRGPVVSVSYTNRPLLVANATDAFSIPFLLVRFDSIKWTHEEQVMPVICKKKRNRTLYRSYH